MPDENNWCPNGCQHLAGLGECGMCGYVGRGVAENKTDRVIEANEETGRYEFQPRSTPEVSLVDSDATGRLTRIAETIYEAGKQFEKDQVQFQRDFGPVFLAAMDKIPERARFPANDGRIPDPALDEIENYGHARGFLKVNSEAPGNLYEDMANVDSDGARPTERLALTGSEKETVREEVEKLQARRKAERDREWERSLDRDDRW